MSIGLKGMSIAGWGVAWVPHSLIAEELANGQLVQGADPSWNIPLEIRLYRSRNNQRGVIEKFWNRLPDLRNSSDHN
jgi:DNA-binding transcriptional LysR family regulator